MSNSDVSFAVFDALLREVGFTKVDQTDAVFRYVHKEFDTDVLVRIRDMQAAVPWGILASTRKILDGRGVLLCADFDRRVHELEQSLGKPVAAANDAPNTAVNRSRSRTRHRSVVPDDQE